MFLSGDSWRSCAACTLDVVIGEKLGLYKALAVHPMTSAELAVETATDERYVREWLASQAAGGYVAYDEKTNRFSLTEEQAFALANEDSPAYLPGAFQLALCSLAGFHESPNPSVREREWAGANMMRMYFTGERSFSAQAMQPIW